MGDCMVGNQLSIKKLLHKMEKQCNFFFKGKQLLIQITWFASTSKREMCGLNAPGSTTS